jgi:hypothetical protein
MSRIRTHEELLEEVGRDAELARFMETQSGTRFFRKHLPSGRISVGVVTPASARTQLGDFDERLFPRLWKESMLHSLVSQWNRLGAGTWQYWAA